MRIEVLYVPGCPNYEPTLKRIERVLASESLSQHVHSVPVHTEAKAISLQFPGSPTVRVNGKDVEPNAIIVPGLACRMYPNGTGIPPEETVQRAISQAKQTEI